MKMIEDVFGNLKSERDRQRERERERERERRFIDNQEGEINGLITNSGMMIPVQCTCYRSAYRTGNRSDIRGY
jgi:hypothetical protein